jgi:valyl-tRNA synthetase
MEPPDGDGWERDEDVLDTWFSSALWPFATLGWPDDTPELRAFYPTDVLSTARDILFLWVARMVMMGIEFAGDIPFKDVYVHSVIQAPDGRRMSKSLGTGIDPIELIDVHGADAVRFGLLAMSSTQDVRFNEDKLAQGANLANKLFNASRLILTRANDVEGDAVEDRWILSRLEAAKAETARAIEAYEFHHAALGLYDFVYGDLCDWYLEIVKPRLETEGGVARRVLRETLAMAHPVIPFVTEEIWEQFGDGLLAESSWPETTGTRDQEAEATVGDAIAQVRQFRAWRDEMGVRPGATLPARYEGTDIVTRLARIEPGEGEVVARVGSIEVLASEHVDLEAGARRVAERRAKLEDEIKRVQGKLANDKFVANAPPEIVAKEREKLAAFESELAAL